MLTSNPGNAPITSSGIITLQPPSGTAIGGVKQGGNVTIAPDGTISSTGGTITSINCVDGIIAAPNPITSVGTIALRPASNLLIGGVIVGNGLNVDGSGLLSLAGGLATTEVAAWATITSNGGTPPTFALSEGYNVSSVAYFGGPNPTLRLTFTNPFLNGAYAVLSSAQVITGPSGSQVSAVLNPQTKNFAYVDFVLQSCSTLDQTVTGGTISWNAYSTVTQIDIAIIDTRTP